MQFCRPNETVMICDYRLKVFYTVAVKGSFTAAAKELGITQPAVSNHISELESAVGDLLFFRDSVRLCRKDSESLPLR